ncbi:hypothetical protein NIES37_67770 [Tolypothrix tenuis PCC 7101]|uniref:DUF1822 family protein n=1 Tax=Tolypothrix tenuis PCC 7101 TaxID=231146 RepID=A0A1Z4NAK8_9CYAN|nr:DUF1822 family protein [Aulosira sp. FACHB-113]BAZ02764.1 hypothetical protein NIES37_67770 [Tolypothrix tenuis PCC 7101]BAZ78343.1 hypothetical protein NIES50_69760 [Aulosira laxa NIES-50]
MKSMTEQLTFSITLTREAHTIAEEYSKSISNSLKQQQIYVNTLAVYAVDSYLQCMGFATDLQASDSRDRLTIKLMNVADLVIENIGKIECRPVLATAEVCEIPAEVWSDRVGYVAVQLSSDCKEATILGFTPQAEAEIPLSQLQSLEDFLLYLSELEIAKSPHHENSSTIVNLGQWLHGFIDTSWQSIEQLLNPQQLGLAFKSAVTTTRGQKIDLGMPIEQISVALVVKISEATASEIEILTQVYPIRNNVLPEGVQLSINDESGDNVLSVTSRNEDNWIQLEFSAELGEKFQIIITHGEFQQSRVFEV